jgi:uncharacterized protein YggE
MRVSVSVFSRLVVVLAMLLAIGAAPARAWEKPFRFSITGHGEVKAVPDIAYLTLGTQTRAKTAAAALAANTKAMRAVFDLLKSKFGMAEKDMATANFAITPVYEHYPRQPGKPTPPPRLVGYDVSNTLTVRVRDLDRLGGIIDAVVRAGANRVQGISFGFSDRRKLLDEARRKAVEDAKARAKLYAEAVGFALGPVVEVREGGVQPLPVRRGRFMAKAMMAEAAAPVPVASGEKSVRVDVTITWLARGE